MHLALISPESEEPRERRILKALFTAGLTRYHVRRPGWDSAKVRRWLMAAPATWRSSLVLHGHPDLAREFGLAGVHWGEATAPLNPPPQPAPSRACHTPEALEKALGHYAAVLYSPVFESLSKPGHAPGKATGLDRIPRILAARRGAAKNTTVYALGGMTSENLATAAGLGFDGAAVLGSVWHAADPVAAFKGLQEAMLRHAA